VNFLFSGTKKASDLELFDAALFSQANVLFVFLRKTPEQNALISKKLR
jgi:hypothetical protein